jgi:hypothetical protein
MPTSPTPVSALPTPPSRDDPSNFAGRADAFLGALPTFRTEANALASNAYANAVEAEADATTATTQAAAAAASAAAASNSALSAASYASASLWVSGTTYALGAVVYSPVTQALYRRTVAGAGTTDPSLDGTNWAAVVSGKLTARSLYFARL